MRIFVFLLAWVVMAASAQPEKLRVGLHYSAPWAYANEQGELMGIDYDILRHIFAQLDVEVQIELYAYERLIQKFRQKELDYISPMAFDLPDAYLTDPYLEIQDVAVTSIQTDFTIDDIADLKGKSIVAYQKASDVLGPVFASVLEQDAYMEMADRERQLDLLKNFKVDVVVGDRKVLEYFSHKNYGKDQLNVHNVFPHTSYPGVFWEASLAEAFNKELDKMKRSGLLSQFHSQTRP
ncbi:transporter substrate-binding domain-containing protein [Lacimicrobium sp. SS2-24]|uniref:substrate-binding periplasmic protein n=1 Tax=Lacimicrobium sp. SS2-24 TaxID=2005569 RepID=UPI000B4B7299|nr:transporter substrate-binding domain-containing protein [Lacimicrobium sp. SS2-24]